MSETLRSLMSTSPTVSAVSGSGTSNSRVTVTCREYMPSRDRSTPSPAPHPHPPPRREGVSKNVHCVRFAAQMPLQFLVLGRFRADTDLDTIRVIIHGEAVAFRVRHHEGVPTRFVRTRRCRLAAPAPAIRIVLILPSLFERLV